MALEVRRWHGWNNPVLKRELARARFGSKWSWAAWVLACLVIIAVPILLGILLGSLVAILASNNEALQDYAVFAVLAGVCPANALAAILGFALPWISPAISAASFSREREMGTWDLLRSTSMREFSIVIGKLIGCLALLWPGLLALAILTPFQIAWRMASGGTGNFLTGLPYLWGESPDAIGFLHILAPALATQLQTWSRILLHTGVGLFISTLFQSTGAAIATTYGAILTLRIAFWLLDNLVLGLLLVLSSIPTSIVGSPSALAASLTLHALIIVFVEGAGTAALVGAATWRIQRG